MISARRAALLGLTVPLTPIMIAVLGLWPEPEDNEASPLSQQVYGSGGRRWAGKAPRWLVPRQAERRPIAQPARPTDADHEAQVRAYWDAIDEIRARDAATQAGAERAPEPAAAVAAVDSAPSAAVAAAPIAAIPRPAPVSTPKPHPDNAALEAILIAELA